MASFEVSMAINYLASNIIAAERVAYPTNHKTQQANKDDQEGEEGVMGSEKDPIMRGSS